MSLVQNSQCRYRRLKALEIFILFQQNANILKKWGLKVSKEVSEDINQKWHKSPVLQENFLRHFFNPVKHVFAAY